MGLKSDRRKQSGGLILMHGQREMKVLLALKKSLENMKTSISERLRKVWQQS